MHASPKPSGAGIGLNAKKAEAVKRRRKTDFPIIFF
jgi:hypothetical protein